MKKSIIYGSLVSLGLVSAASAVTLFGVTTDNALVSFDTAAPATFLSSATITGLFDADGVTPNPNGSILNLSARPGASSGDFQLYGVDNNANFYRINLGGVATLVSSGFTPGGFSAGFAYDPFNDNFVYADDTAENYSIALNGAVSANSDFVYRPGDVNATIAPQIFGLGIDPIISTPYALDANTDTLSISTEVLFPGDSRLDTIGGLGLDVTSLGGLVVDWDGALYAALSTDAAASSLYSIDPTSGLATSLGSFGPNVGLATIAVPEPAASLLGGLAVITLLRRRRA